MAEVLPEAVEFDHRVFDLARAGDDVALAAFVRGVPADLTDSAGNTLLMLAAYHGNAAAVRVLLDRGADPDRVNDRGQTPLSGAVLRGDVDVARILVEAGADPALGSPSAIETARFFGQEQLEPLLHQGHTRALAHHRRAGGPPARASGAPACASGLPAPAVAVQRAARSPIVAVARSRISGSSTLASTSSRKP